MLAAKDPLGDARRWQSDDMIYSIERIEVGALKSPPHLPHFLSSYRRTVSAANRARRHFLGYVPGFLYTEYYGSPESPT